MNGFGTDYTSPTSPSPPSAYGDEPRWLACERPSSMPSIAVIRVVQRREDLRFALEACETVRITREGRRQDLDGDVALRLPIARAVDLTHSSSAEKAADLIARIRTPGARLISVSRCDPLQLFE